MMMKTAIMAIIFFLVAAPVTLAINVNVVYNGQTRQSTQFNSEDVLNWDISVTRNSTDFTWSRVNLHLSVISGDSARPVSKMYLYRCKGYNPIDCVTKVDVPEPLEFGSYADVDLSWNDISIAQGSARYPQVSNLMLLAKLEGENEAWTGLFVRTERVEYNQFNVPFNYELGTVKVFPRSESLITPVKEYIDNFHMIPMVWVDRVSFEGSSALYSLGANSMELENQPVNFRPERPSIEIRNITKDFYFVFPQTVEGVANPITLNLNPTSECGDGTCQASLGESSGTCCQDCGCPSGHYCDISNPGQNSQGTCKPSNMDMQITGLFQQPVTNCENGGITHFTARIINPPSGIVSQEYSGTLEIEDFYLPVDCTGGLSSLDCSFEFSTDIACGKFDRQLEYIFTLPVEYYDGQNTVTEDLKADNIGSPITIRYECKCGDGLYCDVRENACQEDSSMMLNVLEFITPRYNINSGGIIRMFLKIEYAPQNYTVSTTRYNVREILQEEEVLPGLSGIMNCSLDTDYGETDVYECLIPYQIAGYDRTLEYILSKGRVSMNVNFDNVGTPKSLTLATEIPDVLIPPSECNDGRCDKESGETNKTCCMDCGCGSNADLYCDEKKGCQSISAVGLNVQSAAPTSFDDCAEEHTVNIKASIGKTQSTQTNTDSITGMVTAETTGSFSIPTGITVSGYEISEQGGMSEYASISCDDINEVSGALSCQIIISPIEECKSTVTVGPFELQLMVSWPNGQETVEKTLTATIPSVSIKPVSHPGDGECEENYGETAANSCLDCPCEDDAQFGAGYYCDTGSKGGSCKSKSGVNLVIDSPKKPVSFKSCSVDNEVEIKAKISNAPTGTSLQYASGTLDGKDATVTCTPAFGSAGGGGMQTVGGGSLTGWVIGDSVTGRGVSVEEETCTSTGCGIKPTQGMIGTGAGAPFNCVLTVPAEEGCEEDKKYTHTAALSLYISYNNGKTQEVGMVSSPLPEIIINPDEGEDTNDTEIDTVTDLEKTLKEKNDVLLELKETQKKCEGWWDETGKYAGKWLAYKTGQVAVDLIADGLCNAARGAAPGLGEIACIVLKGTSAIGKGAGEVTNTVQTGTVLSGTTSSGVVVGGTGTGGGSGWIIKRDVTGYSGGGGGWGEETIDSTVQTVSETVTEGATDTVADTIEDAVSDEPSSWVQKVENFANDPTVKNIWDSWLDNIDDGDEDVLGFDVKDLLDEKTRKTTIAELAEEHLGSVAGGLSGVSQEFIQGIGQQWIDTQKAKCDDLDNQMLTLIADIDTETQYLIEVKCVLSYQEKLENGECDGINAKKCALELQKCEAEIAKLVQEAAKILKELQAKHQRTQNEINSKMQSAYAMGHAIFVPGEGTLYLDFNGDKRPDRLYCAGKTFGPVEIVATCESEAEPVVKKVVSGEETTLTSLSLKASDIFTNEGPAYFRLYCGDKIVGEDMSVCYCESNEGERCTIDNCPRCAAYLINPEDVKTPADGRSQELCEGAGFVWDEKQGCRECNIESNDCPAGFCGYNTKGERKCLSKAEIASLCEIDCKQNYPNSKPYCNYKFKQPQCTECVENEHCSPVGGGQGYCSAEGTCQERPDLFVPNECLWVCVKDGYFDMLGMWIGNKGSARVDDKARIRVDARDSEGKRVGYIPPSMSLASDRLCTPLTSGGYYRVDEVENLGVNARTWRYRDLASICKFTKLTIEIDHETNVPEANEVNNKIVLEIKGNAVVMTNGRETITLPDSQIKTDCANINVRDMRNQCSWTDKIEGYGA